MSIDDVVELDAYTIIRMRDQRLLADVDHDSVDYRQMIAQHVLCIVAGFAREMDICAAAFAGRVPTDEAEQQVGDLADAAMSDTLPLNGRRVGAVVMEVLIDEGLGEDFQRILRREQHMAFADTVDDPA